MDKLIDYQKNNIHVCLTSNHIIEVKGLETLTNLQDLRH